MKSIIYIDVDAFAVSVERLIHGELVGRPVVVGAQGGERGVVACASYEARALGVRAGMPVGLARRRVEGAGGGQAVFLPPNPIQCERASRRVFAWLHDRAPIVELDKMDGFFLDMTGCGRWMGMPVLGWVERLAARAQAECGMPVSFGIASNKLLARIAARLAKPAGGIWVWPGGEADFLQPVAVGLLPAVGRTTRRELREFGVHRVGQLRAMGDEALRRLYGPAAGDALWRHAHGLCDDPVVSTPMAEALEYDHIFAEDTGRPVDIDQAAALLAQRLAWELRGRGGVRCCSVRIDLIYSDGQHSSRRVRALEPSEREAELIDAVREAAGLAFRRRVRVRSVHVRTALHQETEQQFDFFQEEKQRRRDRLEAAVDEVRARHGFGLLIRAGGAGKGSRVKLARQGSLEDLW